jgi:D-alanine-D-alanine ligase
MTRIGFAYNQKPELDDAAQSDERGARPDEEPPSTHRDLTSRDSAVATTALTSAPDDEYAEWDTRETIDAVAGALAQLGDVIRLEANADFPARLRDAKPDIVFNIAEGLHGVNREAHVPAICEFFGVPYSGSDPFTLSLCLDKSRTKEILSYHGVPNAPFVVVRDIAELSVARESGIRNRESNAANRSANRAARLPTPDSRFPLFVKPVHEGSSKGITERCLCNSFDELEAQVAFLLEHYAQPVLVESYLPGAEFTCAVLGNGDSAQLLPIVAMNFESLPEGALPVFGFEAKWIWDRPEQPLQIFSCPAPIDEALRTEIERVVLQAYRVLGCRDWSRIDVRLDASGVPNIVEVNPLPGILPKPEDNSCFPKAARAAGISYDQLIQRCLLLAAERHGISVAADSRRHGAHARSDQRVAAVR